MNCPHCGGALPPRDTGLTWHPEKRKCHVNAPEYAGPGEVLRERRSGGQILVVLPTGYAIWFSRKEVTVNE